MNNILENKLSMYYKVETFFGSHLTVLSAAIPVLADLHAEFTGNLTTLSTYDAEATEAITGYAAQKQLLRTEMRDIALRVSGAYSALALANNDRILIDKVRYTKSDLDAMRDSDILTKCDRLFDMADANAASLVDYGITATVITDFNNAIGNYKLILATPREQRSESSAYARMVEKKMKEIDYQLQIIDGVMETVSSSHQVLYLQYKYDRMIDDDMGGSPSTPADVVVTLAPNSFTNVFSIPYLLSRAFKAKNLGSDDVQWALSTTAASFSNTPHNLGAGAVSTKLSGTLGADGDILLFYNPSTNPVIVEVTLFE